MSVVLGILCTTTEQKRDLGCVFEVRILAIELNALRSLLLSVSTGKCMDITIRSIGYGCSAIWGNRYTFDANCKHKSRFVGF
jgi:hypothetical protein